MKQGPTYFVTGMAIGIISLALLFVGFTPSDPATIKGNCLVMLTGVGMILISVGNVLSKQDAILEKLDGKHD
jgi:hypothetical protein